MRDVLTVPAPRVARPQAGTRLRAADASCAVALLVTAVAIAWSPPERVQGDLFRLFYVHVPLAWLTYAACALLFGASAAHLRGHRGADPLARAAAELGLVGASLVLVTGSVWGRAVWGVWWTWDARLTATLVMWGLFAACLMVRSTVVDRARAAKIAAWIGILGILDLPIVQLSVDWWRTLHPPPSVTRPGALAPEILAVLTVALIGFGLVSGRVLVVRVRALRSPSG
jgi:heme exporter protein C